MRLFLLHIDHNVTEFFRCTQRWLFQAKDEQMVKWWFHKNMRDRGYVPDGKHSFRLPENDQFATIERIEEIDRMEADVLRDHFPVRTIDKGGPDGLVEHGLEQ